MKDNLRYLFQAQTDQIKEVVLQTVQEIHRTHSEAQRIMEPHGRRGYGHSIWSRLPNAIADAFSENFSQVTFSRPYRRPYSLPVLKDCVFYPWRIPNGGTLSDETYLTHPGLVELLGTRPTGQSPLFSIKDEHTVTSQAGLFPEPGKELRVVFIPLEAVPERLVKVVWGEISWHPMSGGIRWHSQELLYAAHTEEQPMVGISERTFADGQPPKPMPLVHKERFNESE